MALFKVNNKIVKKVNSTRFKNEKELQNLFENNLEEIFGVRFLASEFSTTHGGRIDTLGIDENDAPIIIEYKEGEKDNVINQGLFYLDWLIDHKGDFNLLVQNKLGKDFKVNWDEPRLILVAQSYNEYDKYAINRLMDNVELWRYIVYDDLMVVEKVMLPKEVDKKQNKVIERKITFKEYSLEHHLQGKNDSIIELVNKLREEILKLDSQITEKMKKHYIAYALEKNFAEIVVQSNGLWVHLDDTKKGIKDPKNKIIDVSDKGHWATGNVKIRIENMEDLEYAMNLIKNNYMNSL